MISRNNRTDVIESRSPDHSEASTPSPRDAARATGLSGSLKRAWLAGALSWMCVGLSASMGATGPADNSGLSRADLESYLSRAVTMEGLLHGHGDLDDQIRFLSALHARFAGRTLYLWGNEQNLDRLIETATPAARKVHETLPDLVLQGAIFEIVTTNVEKNAIPTTAFEAFGLPVEERPFSYSAMLYENGRYKNNWGKGASVPDMSRVETQLWFYTLAMRYIDAGIEAIHFGQVSLMDKQDPGHTHWRTLLDHVRDYAAAHARRHFILCDAHVPTGGIVDEGRLLLDFHSFPLRIGEVADQPEQGVLKVGYLDSLYGRSKGGITPSGWRCDHLPYLVEFDNFGRSGREGQSIGGSWIWGYDEICWFAHQSDADRSAWLRYASAWVREHDHNGSLEMPGSRTLAAPVGEKKWYWAMPASAACPDGFGDEAVIVEIWNTDIPEK